MEEPEHISTADNKASRTQQLVEVMQPITDKVQGIVGKVKGMAWVYLAGALVLSGILFFPLFAGQSTWLYAFAGGILLLLCIPSGILFLFHAGLQSIVALPARLLEKTGVGEASARSMLKEVRSNGVADDDRKKGNVLSTLVHLRRLVLDSKDMLFEYTALLRLANPFVLGIVATAAVAGFGVVIAALIAVLILIG